MLLALGSWSLVVWSGRLSFGHLSFSPICQICQVFWRIYENLVKSNILPYNKRRMFYALPCSGNSSTGSRGSYRLGNCLPSIQLGAIRLKNPCSERTRTKNSTPTTMDGSRHYLPAVGWWLPLLPDLKQVAVNYHAKGGAKLSERASLQFSGKRPCDHLTRLA